MLYGLKSCITIVGSSQFMRYIHLNVGIYNPLILFITYATEIQFTPHQE